MPEIDVPWWMKKHEQGGSCDRNLPDAALAACVRDQWPNGRPGTLSEPVHDPGV